MNASLKVVRLKRLQRAVLGYTAMASSRAAMSTVKIPRRLYESALQAWSQVVDNANGQWRRVLSRDQVSKLEPRLGVQIDPSSTTKGEPVGESSLGHDVKTDVLEKILREDQSLPKTPSKMTEASAAAAAKMPAPKPQVVTKVESPKRVVDVPSPGVLVGQDNIDARSRHLIHSIQTADLPSVLTTRLEEFSQHLLKYPECRVTLVKEKALNCMLKLKMEARDEPVKALTRECLSLLGYSAPPGSAGVRILSIDGGGVRGVLVIEVLRQLEKCTGKKISELFDYVVGVSTGAILVGLLTALQKDLEECERLYRTMSIDIFKQSSWWGTGKLVWNHAYYDTMQWQKILEDLYGDMQMINTSRHSSMPRVGILSTIVNRASLVPFLFRNYQLPPREESYYAGACDPRVWQAVRASSSAPFYFEEFELNGAIHQDGGVMQNNPTAAAIHESKLLWPNEKIQCVVSIGCGRYIPEEAVTSAGKTTSLKTKILKIVDSATDTEAVHTLCNDLLPAGSYFRFNPYLSEPITLDETRAEKMDTLRLDAQMYLRRNDKKFEHAAELLVQPRSLYQKCSDYIKDNIQERLV